MLPGEREMSLKAVSRNNNTADVSDGPAFVKVTAWAEVIESLFEALFQENTVVVLPVGCLAELSVSFTTPLEGE